uniref:Mannosyl-oligosaccharide glucosidase n=1 Tax=Brassica campestris TaxID=3711 RepID=M4DGG7_BRACM
MGFTDAHALRPVVTTPFPAPNVMDLTMFKERKESMYWGTYRPQAYFGVRVRDPHPLVAGLMWLVSEQNEPVMRHFCEDKHGLKLFGWTEHNGTDYGQQDLVEKDLVLQTSFVKSKENMFGQVKLSDTAEDDSNVYVFQISTMSQFSTIDIAFISGIDEKTADMEDRTNTLTGSQLTTLLAEKHVAFDEKFRECFNLSEEQVEFKLVPKVRVYRTIVDPKSRVEIVCAEQVVGVYARQAMMMLRNVPAYAASEKLVEIATELELELVLISELAEESSSPPLMWPRSCRRNQMSSSELVILDTGHIFASRDTAIFSQGKDRACYGGTCPALLHHIHDNENGVEARALDERSVCLNASCSEDLLSLERVVKLLGWLLSCQVEIMNFTGRTFVKSSLVPNERLYRQGRELSSSHQRRNSKWTRQSRSSLSCKGSKAETFGLMWTSSVWSCLRANFTGGFQKLHRRIETEAAPRILYERRDETTSPLRIFGSLVWEEGGKFLLAWQRQYNRSRTKPSCNTVASGMDDYPRASHPSDGEMHVDLRCWIYLAADCMKFITTFLQRKKTEEDYSSIVHQLSDFDDLNKMHYDRDHKTYLDFGNHTEKVRLVIEFGRGIRVTDEEPELKKVPHVGYASLFPFMSKIIPPHSEILEQQLDLISSNELACSDYGLLSLAKTRIKQIHSFVIIKSSMQLFVHDTERSDEPTTMLERSHMDEYELHDSCLPQTLLFSNVVGEYDKTRYIWERYDQTKGTGEGGRNFTGWSALILLIMTEDYPRL